jgi:hypothetical protein
MQPGSGRSADSKWVRVLLRRRESNVLVAAALHAAERHTQDFRFDLHSPDDSRGCLNVPALTDQD